jgi:hypothetical protein
MLFISTGIFDDKLHPKILLEGTTENSPLSYHKMPYKLTYMLVLKIDECLCIFQMGTCGL